MKTFFLRFALAGAMAAGSNMASTALAENVGDIVTISARTVFVPVGFDDNDEVVAVLDGYLPSSCYRVVDPEITKDLANRTVSIEAKARYVGGDCLMVLVPYTMTVKLGIMPKGDYMVAANHGATSSPLAVAAATNAGPDDYLYAPIDSTYIQRAQDGTMSATVSGRFTNSCMKFAEHKIFYTGKTIELLPIIEMGDQNCVEGEFPFTKTIALNTLLPGRYLLHVRSLNGASTNTVFPVFENGDPTW